MPKQKKQVFPPESSAQLAAFIAGFNGAPFTTSFWKDAKGKGWVQVQKVRPSGGAATADDPDPAPINESYTCPGNPRCP